MITKGPWAATTRQGSWDWVVFKQDEPNIEICQMFHDGTEYNKKGKANACLVAAAPELLEALRPFAQFACGCGECHNCIAQAAIAKAEGKS
jgi:hypothetical protein